MRNNQAIKPDKIFFSLPSLVKQKLAEKKGVTDEEMALGAMSETSGWTVLKEIIDLAVKDLDKINEGAITSGAGFEEIGRNTVVINLAKGIIKQIVDKVLDAKEAYEQPKEWGWRKK